MKKQAFTLAEVMIVMVTLGLLAAILIPVITKTKPDKTKIMFKKAYYVTERVVSELVNDETLYNDSDADNPHFVDQGGVIIDGVDLDTDASGATNHDKFCLLFASKVNTIGTPACTAAKSKPTKSDAAADEINNTATLGSGNFMTTDGITWHLPTTVAAGYTTVFTDPNDTPAPTTGTSRDILIDINGTSAKTAASPNCTYNVTTCPNPDQFVIHIKYNGKITIDGVKEMEYLKDAKIQ